ncbi:unnamed protein product [Rotaria sp. Silwood2]|nr:unnamed protein product [Rotaria sp. Silwood2]CAF2518755.1 unnamed protein product [Rotaria sp. Silwood2]CAF3283391.1 unnamed protein product [Rotaria sp. Silwood2]CAF3968712.1 unnamed protein product [Rotaria sp. Silwood2]CAF3985199.1 unnamed protein product [Rotaria sp. Silwood2]
MYEASSYMMPKSLGSSLVTIIYRCNPANPLQLFKDFKENMIEDFIQQGNRVKKSLKLCVYDIRMQIQQDGFDFNQFLPFPNFEDISHCEDDLVNCTVNSNNLLWNDLNSVQLLAADTILKSIVGLNSQKCFPIEFLNTLNRSGLSSYKLNLKIACIVMFLRNLSVNKGLCNGIRIIVRAFHQNVLQLEIITDAFFGTVHFIPRISLDTSNDPALPFNFVRHQFPVRLAYAMTINKSQGHTFDKVGLYLPEPCFSHGQFYTESSRATESNGLKIQVKDTTRQSKTDNGKTETDNAVYREIFL